MCLVSLITGRCQQSDKYAVFANLQLPLQQLTHKINYKWCHTKCYPNKINNETRFFSSFVGVYFRLICVMTYEPTLLGHFRSFMFYLSKFCVVYNNYGKCFDSRFSTFFVLNRQSLFSQINVFISIASIVYHLSGEIEQISCIVEISHIDLTLRTKFLRLFPRCV